MQDDSLGQWRLSIKQDDLIQKISELQSNSVIFPHEKEYLTTRFQQYFDSEEKSSPHFIEGVNKNIILLNNGEDHFDVIINRTSEALDYITLLPTRVALFRQIGKWITANKKDSVIALFILELDDFSQINDALDHAVGDLLLFQIARRLETFTTFPFKLVRLHGDEFGFAVSDVEDIETCWTIAKWLADQFELPFDTTDEPLYLKPSIGFSVYPHIADEQTGLMRTAYIALSKSKLDDTQQTYFYDTKHDEGLRRNLVIESELNEALRTEQGLVAYYQPKMSLHTGKIEGVEALIRWIHPTRGIVSPGHFIPVAERTGLICDITNFIVEEVCSHLPTLRKHGFSGPVSINISARDFARKQFVNDVCDILEKYQVSPADIELEITEGAFISDFNYCCVILNSLREKGFRLSIDDFGTGYSSLSYLRKLPVDVLKIDMSFVRDIETSTSVYKTYGALIQIADALSLKVVAEGVDNPDQVTALKQLNCDMIQGYYLSKPQPLEEFCTYIENN